MSYVAHGLEIHGSEFEQSPEEGRDAHGTAPLRRHGLGVDLGWSKSCLLAIRAEYLE